MITLQVRINNKLLTHIRAVRITDNKVWNSYKVDFPDLTTLNYKTGEAEVWINLGHVRHKYTDGANVLAKKMLKLLEDSGHGDTF